MIKFDFDTDLRFRAWLKVTPQLYEVIGYTHQNVVIICAVVRKATL